MLVVISMSISREPRDPVVDLGGYGSRGRVSTSRSGVTRVSTTRRVTRILGDRTVLPLLGHHVFLVMFVSSEDRDEEDLSA